MSLSKGTDVTLTSSDVAEVHMAVSTPLKRQYMCPSTLFPWIIACITHFLPHLAGFISVAWITWLRTCVLRTYSLVMIHILGRGV